MECIHRWNIDSHNIGTCSKCGEVRQFPWEKGISTVLKRGNLSINKEPHQEERMNRHRYYEQYKEKIIADLCAIGRAATRKKWKIPSGGTLNGLEKRWLSQEQRAVIPTPSTPPNNHILPRFPQFSDKWVASVQLKWLEVYDKLISTYLKSSYKQEHPT